VTVEGEGKGERDGRTNNSHLDRKGLCGGDLIFLGGFVCLSHVLVSSSMRPLVRGMMSPFSALLCNLHEVYRCTYARLYRGGIALVSSLPPLGATTSAWARCAFRPFFLHVARWQRVQVVV
jgi:hypothetical protein